MLHAGVRQKLGEHATHIDARLVAVFHDHSPIAPLCYVFAILLPHTNTHTRTQVSSPTHLLTEGLAGQVQRDVARIQGMGVGDR